MCGHVNGYRLNKWEAHPSSMLIGKRVTKALPIYKNICDCRLQTPWDITGCPKLVGWKVRHVRIASLLSITARWFGLVWWESFRVPRFQPPLQTKALTPYYAESSIRWWRRRGSKWWTSFFTGCSNTLRLKVVGAQDSKQSTLRTRTLHSSSRFQTLHWKLQRFLG